MATTMTENILPLTGVRAVELTMNIAGPYGGMVLGDLGATVVKVERPKVGDESRRMLPTIDDTSAYYLAINRNKTAVALDISARRDRARLTELISTADVFVTNLRPTTLGRYDLDAQSLMGKFGQLIYADITGYGMDGPDSALPGYDMVLQARSGLMSVNGSPEGPPVRVGVSILDIGSGLWLALGVLAALRLRDNAGRGSRVSTSLLEVGHSLMGYDLVAYQLTGVLPPRRGTGHPAFSPYGLYPARDGDLAIGVGSDAMFRRLAMAMGLSELGDDPHYSSNEQRLGNSADLRVALEHRLNIRGVSEWLSIFRQRDIPCDVVADAAALLTDPQLRAIDAWVPLSAGAVNVAVPRAPLRFDGCSLPKRLDPPALPNHSDLD